MKKIEALLLVAVCVLSFVCYKQHKQIQRIESELYYLDDKFDSIDSKQEELESKQEDMEISISELQEEMEEHFPKPTYYELRQAAIARIRRFNAAREKEKDSGAVNTPEAVAKERQVLYMLRKYYNIDIELK